ncbi:hypothetical protein D4764_22G0001310 [Takifugu flavidus]|uniref:Uncharacterized protein n=1 Tax=Takifugu flavidus TaxID=433684 RepID=A0A5C6NAH4_9TELE|nr:hypothetical protein D4764_22G0001310 [Takifugu flavidus]
MSRSPRAASRRGALSVLPRTRCQTPLPPPSMRLLRGQPAEWRTSPPGCLHTCDCWSSEVLSQIRGRIPEPYTAPTVRS